MLTLRCCFEDPKCKYLTFGYLQVEVLQKLDVSYFGEGLTLLGERFGREKKISFSFTLLCVQ